MKTLTESLKDFFYKKQYILEGGASGHMAHPIDFEDFTANDLKQLIKDIFSGKIEDVTEKIDGVNIQATMNKSGEVVFIRNQGDLNSERGGMSIEDMANKWKERPSTAETFVSAGKIISQVFEKIGTKFFNPDDETRVIANCECVIEGVTNIMPYGSAQVDFHNLWIYKLDNGKWINTEVTMTGLDKIDKACEGIDNAQLTPKLIIEITEKSNELAEKYCKEIDKLFGEKDTLTIDEWKYDRYFEYISTEYPWLLYGRHDALYARWFNGDKSVNLRVLKQVYVDNVDELMTLDKKGYKKIVSDVIEPLDLLFLNIGNDVIKLCKGLLNGSKSDSVIKRLQADMKEIVADVKANGTIETQDKLIKQLNRLEQLGGEDSINSTEGIVFRYKGKLMKMTGSFAPVNQILGSIKFSR